MGLSHKGLLRGEETHVEVCVIEVDLVPLCLGDLAEDRVLGAVRLVFQRETAA